MRHLSLFTGIGGFEYAAQTVWGDKWEPVLFCENDQFCQKVLRKHWPYVPIHSDIRDLNCEEYQGTVDLLTGGFPCQPYSMAGKQKGAGDDRALWPEMLRIIQEGKPTGIIGENVAGLSQMVEFDSHLEVDSEGCAIGEVGTTLNRTGRGILKEILESLEAEGYEVQPLIIPACAVGACHRRDRVWIIAHLQSERSGGLSKSNGRHDSTNFDGSNQGFASNSDRQHGNDAGHGSGEVRREQRQQAEIQGCDNCRPQQAGTGNQRRPVKQQWTRSQATVRNIGGEHWYEAATRICRMDVQSARGVDRTARLKALGNTIQWEVAAGIMQAIKDSY